MLFFKSLKCKGRLLFIKQASAEALYNSPLENFLVLQPLAPHKIYFPLTSLKQKWWKINLLVFCAHRALGLEQTNAAVESHQLISRSLQTESERRFWRKLWVGLYDLTLQVECGPSRELCLLNKKNPKVFLKRTTWTRRTIQWARELQTISQGSCQVKRRGGGGGAPFAH